MDLCVGLRFSVAMVLVYSHLAINCKRFFYNCESVAYSVFRVLPIANRASSGDVGRCWAMVPGLYPGAKSSGACVVRNWRALRGGVQDRQDGHFAPRSLSVCGHVCRGHYFVSVIFGERMRAMRHRWRIYVFRQDTRSRVTLEDSCSQETSSKATGRRTRG